MDWNIVKLSQEASKAEKKKRAILQRQSVAPWMLRSRKTKDLPSLSSSKRSSKKSMSSAPSRRFSVAQETPGLDDIFEHINLACKRAAISKAPDPIAFLAQYLRVAADKRDAKLDMQEKQMQEHKEIIARRKAKEQAKHLEVRKKKWSKRFRTLSFSLLWRWCSCNPLLPFDCIAHLAAQRRSKHEVASHLQPSR